MLQDPPGSGRELQAHSVECDRCLARVAHAPAPADPTSQVMTTQRQLQASDPGDPAEQRSLDSVYRRRRGFRHRDCTANGATGSGWHRWASLRAPCRYLNLLNELDWEPKLPAESAAYGQGARVVLAVELARWG